MAAGSILRRTAGALVIGALFVVPGRVAEAETKTVTLQGNSFVPAGVTIDAGDGITWTNEDVNDHTVTFEELPFDEELNGCLAPLGCEGVELTFDEPGTYAYYCRFHGEPGGVGMAGVVSVEAPATTTSSTDPTTTTATDPSTTTTATTAPSTTTTTRLLATSSTTALSTATTGGETTTTLTPNEAPVFDPGDGAEPADDGDPGSEEAADEGIDDAGEDDEGVDAGTVAAIVGLLAGVGALGGVLLWRLRPGRRS